MDPEFIQTIDSEIFEPPGSIGTRYDFDEFLKNLELRKVKNETAEIHDKIIWFIIRYHNYAWVGDAKGKFAKWYSGRWYFDVDVSLNRLIRHYVKYSGLKYSPYTRDDIRARIKEARQMKIEQFNRNREVMNFKNGWVDTTDFTFHGHRDKHMDYDRDYTIQIPHDYFENKTPLKFIPWLLKTIKYDWEKFDLIMKAVGCTLYMGVKFQKLFMVKGPGKTGKSTFLNILAAIVGEDNCSSISVQRLSKRFGTSGIVFKLLNFYADISVNKAITDSSRIKILIDDKIDYEIKGAGFHVVDNTVKHWFSTNNMPPVIGLDLAYCRRWVIIVFDRVIPTDELIPDFERTIIADEKELEAIISLAVDAFKELSARGMFVAQSAEEVMEIIMQETDTVYRFIKQMCDEDARFEDIQESIYEAYVDFAAADGAMKVLKKPQFTQDLYSKGFGKGRIKNKNEDGKRPYTYTGLKLKETIWVDPKSITPSQITIDMLQRGRKKSKVTNVDVAKIELDYDTPEYEEYDQREDMFDPLDD